MRLRFGILLILSMVLFTSFSGAAQDDEPQLNYKGKPFSYIPKLGFAFRARGAYSFEYNGVNFNVRNARVSIRGMAAPFLSYKAEVDFYDHGKFTVTDANLRGFIGKQFYITLGRMRDPFGVDVATSPATQPFADRSFLANQMSNWRDLGISFTYYPTRIPMIAEAGIFNGSGDTMAWHGQPLASARIGYRFGEIKVSTSFRTFAPDSIRTNLVDAALSWTHDRFFAEAEYVYQHYTKNSYPNSHGVNVYANYTIPMQSRIVSALLFGARFDYMSDHSSGIRDPQLHCLVTDEPKRCRLTVGAALLRLDKVNARLRLDYEKYFTDKDVILPGGAGDNIVLELVVYM